jgi:hypothetical protein
MAGRVPAAQRAADTVVQALNLLLPPIARPSPATDRGPAREFRESQAHEPITQPATPLPSPYRSRAPTYPELGRRIRGRSAGRSRRARRASGCFRHNVPPAHVMGRGESLEHLQHVGQCLVDVPQGPVSPGERPYPASLNRTNVRSSRGESGMPIGPRRPGDDARQSFVIAVAAPWRPPDDSGPKGLKSQMR